MASCSSCLWLLPASTLFSNQFDSRRIMSRAFGGQYVRTYVIDSWHDNLSDWNTVIKTASIIYREEKTRKIPIQAYDASNSIKIKLHKRLKI